MANEKAKTTKTRKSKKENGLEFVSVRLNHERTLYSEKEISGPRDAVELLANEMDDFDREHFIVLSLATNGQVINANICSVGTLNATLVSPREVFKPAILSNASCILVLHNHPSGNLTPSREDDELTRRLAVCGKMLDIKLLDHIVVGHDGNYFSYKGEGNLESFNMAVPDFMRFDIREPEAPYSEVKEEKKDKESFRDKVANEFIRSLEEDPKNWVKKWASNDTGRPFNMASGREYNGLNAMWLKFIERHNNFRDPRWLTFNQVKKLNEERAEDNQIKIPKGTKMTQVEYFFMWDHLNKKTIPWEEYNRLSAEEKSQRVDGEGNLVTDPSLMGNKIKDRFELRSRDHYVFNASQLENMPEFVYDKVENEIAPSEVVNRIAEGMGVKIREEEQDRAFYRPSIDTITLPLKSQFESDYDYQSTALHELGHATGHESRLNRNIHNGFGSPEYAYEELIAEMTSCFMGEYVESPMNDQDLDNHIAYVQNWIEAIKKDKNYLFKAIKEADKAADYMIEKGNLEELKEVQAVETTKETVALDPSILTKTIEDYFDREGVDFEISHPDNYYGEDNHGVILKLGFMPSSGEDRSEDFLIEAETEAGAIYEFRDQLWARFQSFDVDEYVATWLDAKARGVSGVPGAAELVDAAKVISDSYENWAISVNQYVSQYESGNLSLEPKRPLMTDYVKEWYQRYYPTDSLGEEINEDLRFHTVSDWLYNTEDNTETIYELIGVWDSIVRERIFIGLASAYGADYDTIYDRWFIAESGESVNGEEVLSASSDNISIAGHEGTWYVVGVDTRYGEPVFELEHEEYGDEAAHLIVDEKGRIFYDDIWNGFDEMRERDEINAQIFENDRLLGVLEDVKEYKNVLTPTLDMLPRDVQIKIYDQVQDVWNPRDDSEQYNRVLNIIDDIALYMLTDKEDPSFEFTDEFDDIRNIELAYSTDYLVDENGNEREAGVFLNLPERSVVNRFDGNLNGNPDYEYHFKDFNELHSWMDGRDWRSFMEEARERMEPESSFENFLESIPEEKKETVRTLMAYFGEEFTESDQDIISSFDDMGEIGLAHTSDGENKEIQVNLDLTGLPKVSYLIDNEVKKTIFFSSYSDFNYWFNQKEFSTFAEEGEEIIEENTTVTFHDHDNGYIYEVVGRGARYYYYDQYLIGDDGNLELVAKDLLLTNDDLKEMERKEELNKIPVREEIIDKGRTFTILSSEVLWQEGSLSDGNYIYGQKFDSVASLEKALKRQDRIHRENNELGYDKTKITIKYITPGGFIHSYTDRFDVGDGEEFMEVGNILTEYIAYREQGRPIEITDEDLPFIESLKDLEGHNRYSAITKYLEGKGLLVGGVFNRTDHEQYVISWLEGAAEEEVWDGAFPSDPIITLVATEGIYDYEGRLSEGLYYTKKRDDIGYDFFRVDETGMVEDFLTVNDRILGEEYLLGLITKEEALSRSNEIMDRANAYLRENLEGLDPDTKMYIPEYLNALKYGKDGEYRDKRDLGVNERRMVDTLVSNYAKERLNQVEGVQAEVLLGDYLSSASQYFGFSERELPSIKEVLNALADEKYLDWIIEHANYLIDGNFNMIEMHKLEMQGLLEEDEVKNVIRKAEELAIQDKGYRDRLLAESISGSVKEPDLEYGEKEKTLKVLLVRAGREAEMVEIEDSLEGMQRVVGGMIEEYMPWEDDVAIVCNEEGKMNGMPMNRAVKGDDGNYLDVIAGDFFICYAPFDSEKFLSLPDDLAEKYMEKFRWPEQIFLRNGNVLVVHPYNPGYRESEAASLKGVNEPSFTYCTKEEWEDEDFDLDYLESENGRYGTYEEAKREGEKHGASMVIQVEEPEATYKPSLVVRPVGLNTFGVMAPSGDSVHADCIYMGTEEECDKYIEIRNKIDRAVNKNGYELVDFGRKNISDDYLYSVLAYNKSHDWYTVWSYNSEFSGLYHGDYCFNDEASARTCFYRRMDEALRPPYRVTMYSGQYFIKTVENEGIDMDSVVESELSVSTDLGYAKTEEEGRELMKGLAPSVSKDYESGWMKVNQVALEFIEYDEDGDLLAKEVIMTGEKPMEYGKERIMTLEKNDKGEYTATFKAFEGDPGFAIPFDGRGFILSFPSFAETQMKSEHQFWRYAIERDPVSARDTLIDMYSGDAYDSLDYAAPEGFTLSGSEREQIKNYFKEELNELIPREGEVEHDGKPKKSYMETLIEHSKTLPSNEEVEDAKTRFLEKTSKEKEVSSPSIGRDKKDFDDEI